MSTRGYSYTFTEPGLDWSSVATRRVYLSVPDATPPVLSAMEVNAATLTMIYDEPLKTTAPTRSGGGNPTIVVKRSGKTGAITVSNVRAGTGTNKNEVTMTLNPALEHGDRIEVTYDRTNTVTASRIQDLSGNKAVALRSDSSVVNTTPSGPSVTGIAFAGAETVYAIGDAIAVDVTFNERVRVTGEPTIMLGVGSTPRTARWKMGQSPGDGAALRVHRSPKARSTPTEPRWSRTRWSLRRAARCERPRATRPWCSRTRASPEDRDAPSTACARARFGPTRQGRRSRSRGTRPSMRARSQHPDGSR